MQRISYLVDLRLSHLAVTTPSRLFDDGGFCGLWPLCQAEHGPVNAVRNAIARPNPRQLLGASGSSFELNRQQGEEYQRQ